MNLQRKVFLSTEKAIRSLDGALLSMIPSYSDVHPVHPWAYCRIFYVSSGLLT